MITSPLNTVYIGTPRLDHGKLAMYEVVECNNSTAIYDQYKLYIKRPDIYNLEHWFCNRVLCNEFVQKQNKSILYLGQVDFFMHRYNLTEKFVGLNFRAIQKLTYTCNNLIKGNK